MTCAESVESAYQFLSILSLDYAHNESTIIIFKACKQNAKKLQQKRCSAFKIRLNTIEKVCG